MSDDDFDDALDAALARADLETSFKLSLAQLRCRGARQARVEAFHARQRKTRKWTSWEWIADWIARDWGANFQADQAIREAVYRQLVAALVKGWFDHPCWGHGVRILIPYAERGVRTIGVFRPIYLLQLAPSGWNASIIDTDLKFCWLPRAMARRWFEDSGYRVPEILLDPSVVATDRTQLKIRPDDQLDCLGPQKAEADAEAKPAKSNRKPQGLDYRQQDQPIMEKMREMIERGEAKNPTDAARALAKEAAGSGTEESKVKRLITRHSVVFRAERDGKD